MPRSKIRFIPKIRERAPLRTLRAAYASPQQLDPVERIEPVLLTLAQIKQAILEKTPVDRLLLSALFLAGLTR